MLMSLLQVTTFRKGQDVRLYLKSRALTLKSTYSIHDWKHELFYQTLKSIATRLVKNQIITAGMEYVDRQLVGILNRVASAKPAEGESRTKVLQEVNVVPPVLASSRLSMVPASTDNNTS